MSFSLACRFMFLIVEASTMEADDVALLQLHNHNALQHSEEKSTTVKITALPFLQDDMDEIEGRAVIQSTTGCMTGPQEGEEVLFSLDPDALIDANHAEGIVGQVVTLMLCLPEREDEVVFVNDGMNLMQTDGQWGFSWSWWRRWSFWLRNYMESLKAAAAAATPSSNTPPSPPATSAPAAPTPAYYYGGGGNGSLAVMGVMGTDDPPAPGAALVEAQQGEEKSTTVKITALPYLQDDHEIEGRAVVQSTTGCMTGPKEGEEVLFSLDPGASWTRRVLDAARRKALDAPLDGNHDEGIVGQVVTLKACLPERDDEVVFVNDGMNLMQIDGQRFVFNFGSWWRRWIRNYIESMQAAAAAAAAAGTPSSNTPPSPPATPAPAAPTPATSSGSSGGGYGGYGGRGYGGYGGYYR